MICVLPQPQSEEHGISCINNAISIATIFRLVEFRQGQKAIGNLRIGLRCKIAEQFSSAINQIVSISIKHQEGICRPYRCPCDLHRSSIGENVKHNTVCRIGERETGSIHVNDNW